MFPFTRISRRKWLAKRNGRNHGRQGTPPIDWVGGPVGYLDVLKGQYNKAVQTLVLRLRVVEGQSLTAGEIDVADKNSLNYQATQLEKERSVYEEDFQKLLKIKTGEPSDNPHTKSANYRHIPLWVYVLALVFLAVGEYFVTYPAVTLVLGDDEGWRSYVITASFSALSIIAAHLIGLTFKIELDRSKPQPGYHRWVALIVFVVIFFAVLFLSALRSSGVSAVPVKFGLSDEAFGTVLFLIIQMSFILCAITLSYYFHSDLESEIRSVRRKIKRLTKRIRSITHAINNPNKGILSPEKREVQIKAIRDDIEHTNAEYHELCAVYRTANLLAQKSTFTKPGPGLTEAELDLPQFSNLGA